jgi:AcrR family transcriptional regulator
MDPAARKRLFDALLAELGTNGFEAIRLSDVLRLCNVSKAAFEAEFKDTEASLFAAFDRRAGELRQRVKAACDVDGHEWPHQIHRGLAVLLRGLAADPDAARVLVRSFPAIGPNARRHYQDFVYGFAPLLSAGRDFSALAAELPSEVEMLAIGAAEAIIYDEIQEGRAASLDLKAPEILFSILVPFIGPESASIEMELARNSP